MSRSDLVALAERLMRSSGAEALTMEALAAAAGLSRATLYRQVGSREALMEELSQRGVDVGDRDDFRSRILRAAGQVFGRLGLDGATIEAIAEAAGTGTATVYRHFSDKRGLIEAFAQQHTPRRIIWQAADKPSGDVRRDLTKLVTAVLQHLLEHGDILRLALGERARGSTVLEDLARSPRRGMHGMMSLLRHYIERGDLAKEDPEQMARALMGMLFAHGLLGPIMGMPGPADPPATAMFIVRIFLDGLRAPAGRGKGKKEP